MKIGSGYLAGTLFLLLACNPLKVHHSSGGDRRTAVEDTGAENGAADSSKKKVADEEVPDEPVKRRTVSDTPANEPDEVEDQTADNSDNGSGSDQQGTDVSISGSQDGECYKTDETTCKIELAILALVNAERANPTKGFGRNTHQPFLNGKKLSYVARTWSETQAQRGSIGHDGFPQQRLQAFLTEFGNRPRLGAENVASFGGGANSPEQIAGQFFEMWYNSSGHYANMMKDFVAIGIGVAKSGSGWYATQIFGNE